jgi:hypothetical protein
LLPYKIGFDQLIKLINLILSTLANLSLT